MKVRFVFCLTVFSMICGFSSNAFADELPEVPTTPTFAQAPSLPSIDAFGTPSPPDILENAEAHMPDMEFWQEKKVNVAKETSTPPSNGSIPVDPSYAAIFAWPVRGKISSAFGFRGRRMHEGIDIPVPSGTPIQAAASGVVAEARTYRGYGHTVVIDHNNGTKTLYAHCSKLTVQKGETVESGQVVALAGNTGRSTASHVHFGVFVKGAFQNPMAFLKEPYQHNLALKP